MNRKATGILAIAASLTLAFAAQTVFAEDEITVTKGMPQNIYEYCPWNSFVFVTEHDQMYECLTTYDENNELVGLLAESWDISEDGMLYTFHMREDITFQNGDPMTAEDAEWSLTQALNSGAVNILLSEIDSFHAVDTYTLEMKMKHPYSAILGSLAINCYPIVDKKAVEEYGYDWPEGLSGVGTGPYIIDTVEPDKLTLVKNKDYWQGEPQVDKVIFKTIPDASTAAIALETGEIDLYNYVSELDVETLKSNPDLTVQEQQNIGNVYVECNVSETNAGSPIANKAVRQAISLALNREELNLLASEGNGIGTCTLIPPELPEYDASLEFEQDLDKARELMAEAGYADGCNLSLVYHTNYPAFSPLAEGMQAQLAQIGINLELKMMDQASFESVVRTEEYGDMVMNVIYMSVIDPVYTMYYAAGTTSIGLMNWSYYSNPEFDRLCQESRASLDVEKRKELVGQAQKILLEDCPTISLVNGGCNRTAYNSSRFDNVFVDWDKHVRIWKWQPR